MSRQKSFTVYHVALTASSISPLLFSRFFQYCSGIIFRVFFTTGAKSRIHELFNMVRSSVFNRKSIKEQSVLYISGLFFFFCRLNLSFSHIYEKNYLNKNDWTECKASCLMTSYLKLKPHDKSNHRLINKKLYFSSAVEALLNIVYRAFESILNNLHFVL